MIHVYAKGKRTFLLSTSDGSRMYVRPNGFYDIPDKFTGDITYRRAVESGDIQPYETVKQADKAQELAQQEQGEKASDTPEQQEQTEQSEAAIPTCKSGAKRSGDSK